MADVLVISGPAGVGKSSAAYEITHRLQARGIDHAMIDTDELDRIFPVPPDLARITERNLASMWQTFSDRDIHRLILTGVYLDRPAELAWVARAVPSAEFTLVRLLASEATLVDRVNRREIGSGRGGQLARTRHQLAASWDARDGVHLLPTDDGFVTEIADRIIGLRLDSV